MGLFRRGSIWWFRVSVGGKLIRGSTGAEDKKLALRVFDKVKGQIAEGKWFRKLPERWFEEMMEKFLDEHASKKASYSTFMCHVKNMTAFFGNCSLVQITPRLINEYKNKRCSDGVKPATINRELATLKKAFNLAFKEWEWIESNPVSKVSMEQEDNKRDRWLTLHEEERLLKACPLWLREVVIFALNTGMRLSEILELSWEAVDLFRKTVTVFRSKNKERRTLPLNGAAIELLKSKAKVRLIKTNLVFYGPRGHNLLGKRNVSWVFHTVARRAEISDFRFHDLRHTFATRLIQAGVDLYKVQRLLGHKSPSMTQRYAHHWPESLRHAVEVLDSTKTDTVQRIAHERY
jgi:site-specific recombinase XerD